MSLGKLNGLFYSLTFFEYGRKLIERSRVGREAVCFAIADVLQVSVVDTWENETVRAGSLDGIRLNNERAFRYGSKKRCRKAESF